MSSCQDIERTGESGRLLLATLIFDSIWDRKVRFWSKVTPKSFSWDTASMVCCCTPSPTVYFGLLLLFPRRVALHFWRFKPSNQPPRPLIKHNILLTICKFKGSTGIHKKHYVGNDQSKLLRIIILKLWTIFSGVTMEIGNPQSEILITRVNLM